MGLAALFPVLAAAGEPVWLESLPKGLEAARAGNRRVLVDFQAPWCYSCYYMDQKVLSKPAFASAAEGLVLVKLDVDTPEGRALKEKYRVTFLPSYVVAGPDGRETGRIIGEQAEADFLARLKAVLGAAADPADRAIESLRRRLALKEFEEAARDVREIDKQVRGQLARRREWRILLSRLEIMRAPGDSKIDWKRALRALLEQEESCELAYDVYHAEKLLEKGSGAGRAGLLNLERGALERLAEKRLFKNECADFRTGIEVLAAVYEGLGLTEEKTLLVNRAVEMLLGKDHPPGEDRNRDDNLRYFLEMKKDDAALRSLYPRLVAAYPADYVYAHRFGRYLLEQGRPAEALPWLDRADKLCYGANRLAVTKARAKALAALGRLPEAVAILKRDIAAGRAAFPADADGLEKVLTELQAAAPR